MGGGWGGGGVGWGVEGKGWGGGGGGATFFFRIIRGFVFIKRRDELSHFGTRRLSRFLQNIEHYDSLFEFY